MATHGTNLTPWEKLDFAFRLLFILPAAYAFALVRGLPQAKARGMNVKFVALSLLIREILVSTNPRYFQAIAPPTQTRYKKWLISKRQSVASQGGDVSRRLNEDIESIQGTDTSICWLGDRTRAEKVVLFFHGGGYLAPATKGHFEWCWNAYITGGPGLKYEVAVAIVQYTIAPAGKYPQQLRQCCAALDHLLKRGIAPSDMLMGGDSAGGNLAIQVLRHLIEPHPGISPVQLRGPLAGVFLVSPLVDGRIDARSYTGNGGVDMINKQASLISSECLFQEKPRGMSVSEQRSLAFPMEGNVDWVKGIGSVVKAMYVTVGRQESFLDDVVAFIELLKRKCGAFDLTFQIAEHEAHDYILLEGILETGFDATGRMADWASQVV